MVEQFLYEPRNFEHHGLVLVSPTYTDPRLEKEYRKIGNFDALSDVDFGTKDYHYSANILIRLIGSLAKPSNETETGLTRLLKGVNELGIDSSVAINPEIRQLILKNEMVSGRVYLLRFRPTNEKAVDTLKGKNMCELYVCSEEDRSLRLSENELMQGETKIEPIAGQLGLVLKNRDMEGIVSLSHIGNISDAHRGHLSPFISEGRMGSNHINPARVVFLEGDK